MYRYAQIDPETGLCIAVSMLNGLVDGAHMILLRDDQEVKTGDYYADGQWTVIEPEEPTPSDPGPSQDEVIAGITLEVAELNVRLTENEKTTADLLLALATGGV